MRAKGHVDTGRAGTIEGIVLVMGCWCTVLAAGLVAPILPAMQTAFAGTPHVDLMIGLVATAPALMVAFLALPIGALVDRGMARRLLLAGLALYGCAGVLPLWLADLPAIIVSRVAAGIGEGAVMMASTALIARRFDGARRDRWLSIQVAAANVLGIAVVLGGGVLGLSGWHAPFAGYAFGLLMLVPAALVVREPAVERPSRGVASAGAMPGRAVAVLCALNVLVTVAMFSIILQLGFLLVDRGAGDSAAIGVGIAIGAAGTASGAMLSGRFAAFGWRRRAGIGLAVAALGFGSIFAASSLDTTIAAAALAGAGAGFALPALLSALVAAVPLGDVGRAVGFWTVANFLGQFATPPIMIAIAAAGGGRAVAFAAIGAACLAVALPLLARARRSR